MKIEGSNNFILRRFQIEAQSGELSLSSNHLLELHYIEDITKSNIMVAVTINDTETALVSRSLDWRDVILSFKTIRTMFLVPVW